MEGQDWKPVVFTKTYEQLVKEKKISQKKVKGGGGGNKNINYIKTDEDDNPIKKKINKFSGKLIQKERVNKKLSRKDLASKCNIKESILGDYESGKIPIPGNHKVIICKHLGITNLNKK